MRGELYILSAEEQFLSTQSHHHSVFWHTGFHRIIIFIISNFISLLLLTLKRVVEPFLGCHYVSFPTRPLGLLELLSISPLSFFSASHEVQPPTRLSQEPSDLHGLEPDGPPWASLILSAFGRLSRDPSVPRTIWSEWTWSGHSPLACCKISLNVFLGWSPYVIYCALLNILHFDAKTVSLLIQIIQCKYLFSSLLTQLFNYCSISTSIIVQYYDPRNHLPSQ